MGTYLYEQTSKKIKVHRHDYGVITINEIKYYCKPYWDLWEGSTPLNEQEKRIAAEYRRKQAVAAKRTPNEYVMLSSKDGTYVVYKWRDDITPPILFSDDDNFGINLLRLGKLGKLSNGHWFFEEDKPKPDAQAQALEQQLKRTYKKYLDSIRESGRVNIFGAAPYLKQAFPDLSDADCKKIIINYVDEEVKP
ncbi:hypothetical protein Gbem_3002 [Citrifermentans bemidjiense Bem]|uniref:Uncharacterized protein n=1 Tax=Citrifermentans bemidjiense (strain ATCC BAA-1014 / DSM 16622 / JCM 12645 / Bem) TaxID=404380 RepID=B5E836_CITBB|nr:hypothetical protein [Citrifermentans bemidjiense]ACH40005.1 hypothetical protein Gbem_3002 [Citrifermentans bemidjiense Bem]